MPKDVLIIDNELIKEGIKLIMEEFGRLHILQIADGLKTLLECEIEASDFLRSIGTLNDISFISSSFHGYWKINKDFIDYPVSKADINRIELLRVKFLKVKADLKAKFENQ